MGFPDVWGGRLEGRGKKRRESGLKWGIGACGGRRRGAGRAFGAVSRRPWGCGGCLAGCSSTVAQNGV